MKIGMALLALALFIVGCSVDKAGDPQAGTTASAGSAGGFKLSGPYTHDNLTIYLIHGEDRLKGKNYLTLTEAMEQKKIIVHETGEVNELTVENVSGEEIFIIGGDIVKGGKQDRTLAVDIVLPPNSGKIPVDSFCVEHGRWSQRGGETATAFAGNTFTLSSKELKLAAKGDGDQQKVWAEVERAQHQLAVNAGKSVQSGESESSLQLTMENKDVQAAVEQYVNKLSAIVDGKSDVIGYAFAINGKVNSVDIYASAPLFRKLWSKLLNSTAVEAFANLKRGESFAPVTAEAIALCMADAEKGKAEEKDVSARVKLVTQETEKNVLFESRDNERKGEWIRRNYLSK
ncbi:MAG: hypothetical protein A2Z34_03350 [Planctomycetes bacterium RBG_16_59_8]|nr:MAG: hypothetical protein A2Z34_03350 [Planctomycetes bacterium RBG_16_59_8]